MQIFANGQSTPIDNFVPFPGGATVVYTSSGTIYVRHPDWLGSSRFASTTSTRTMYFDTAYAPFGEPYASNGTSDLNFTGMNADTTSSSNPDYDFLYREYSTVGRWGSPDPAGLAAVNPSNPQSWNRYSYVINSPLNYVDPLGLKQCIRAFFGPVPCVNLATNPYDGGNSSTDMPDTSIINNCTCGYDISDAIAGEAGTYLEFNMWGDVYYYFTDHLGSTRSVTQADGTVCFSADYYPYGEEVDYTNSCPQNYKFTGYERDAETGLDYAFARHYNSRMARFMSADSWRGVAGAPQSHNAYSYVVNNPVVLVDRFGACPGGVAQNLDPNQSGDMKVGGPSATASDTFDPQGIGSSVPPTGPCRGFTDQGGGAAGTTLMSIDGGGAFAPSDGGSGILGNSESTLTCPNGSCRGVDQDNLPIQFIATMVGTGYECLLSGTYGNQRAAGTAAAGCANGVTMATGDEACGNLDSNDGSYSFTLPAMGGSTGCSTDTTAVPAGTLFAGRYHSHPNTENGLPEQFSPINCNQGQMCDIGTATYLNNGQPLFLGTPTGRVLVYDPTQADDFPYGCVLVGSPGVAVVGPGVVALVPKCQ